ncbi:hypothetical protein [Streptomyces sp. NBC_00878]|uniref:hypothetical protein n=1 Tax=Streptomyces sp. NBC_00878 TaxID=2975854 RepID=UPI002253F7C7|nr:hypothetical protein [Streptomyces sp. NBC_00878]MCX4907625.1 hypothetical protein [Streptomyces sp. NBC_00878]
MADKVQPKPIKLMWLNTLDDVKRALDSAAELGLGIDISSEFHRAGDHGGQDAFWRITLYDGIPKRDPDSEQR